MITCPHCGHEQEMDPGSTYLVNLDHPYNINRRKYGFWCRSCLATIYIREDGLLDILHPGDVVDGKLQPGRWEEGVKPKYSSEFFGVEVSE